MLTIRERERERERARAIDVSSFFGDDDSHRLQLRVKKKIVNVNASGRIS